MLASMLRSRLPDLVERNEEQWQRTHACWAWTAANLSAGAAIKVALMQSKPLEDLRCCDVFSSLWSHREADFIEVTGDKTQLVGSYLFYCPIAARIIRSGKVYGTSANFGTRHSAHEKGARMDTSESQTAKFYMSYPSRTSAAVTRSPELNPTKLKWRSRVMKLRATKIRKSTGSNACAKAASKILNNMTHRST